MGLTVNDSLNIQQFGLSLSGLYVTLRGSYSLLKKGAQSPFPFPMHSSYSDKDYTLVGRYLVFANSTSTQPLDSGTVTVGLNLDEIPANGVGLLYSQLKSTVLAGKNVTDDL